MKDAANDLGVIAIPAMILCAIGMAVIYFAGWRDGVAMVTFSTMLLVLTVAAISK